MAQEICARTELTYAAYEDDCKLENLVAETG